MGAAEQRTLGHLGAIQHWAEAKLWGPGAQHARSSGYLQPQHQAEQDPEGAEAGGQVIADHPEGAEAGGHVVDDHPEGVEAGGHVIANHAPEAEGKALPRGKGLVLVQGCYTAARPGISLTGLQARLRMETLQGHGCHHLPQVSPEHQPQAAKGPRASANPETSP